MGSERVNPVQAKDSVSEQNKDSVVLELVPVLPMISKTKLVLSLGNRYRIVILKQSRTKGIYNGVIDLGSKPCYIDDFSNETELADMLRGCPDPIIASNADEIATGIFENIKRWKALLALKELGKINVSPFNSLIVSTGRVAGLVLQRANSANSAQNQTRNPAGGYNYTVEWYNQFLNYVRELRERFNPCVEGTEIKKRLCQRVVELSRFVSNINPENLRIDDILRIIATVFGEEIAELVELVASVGLTLKFVDRARGIVNNRPVWLMIISRPSSLKTTVLNLFKESPYVFYVTDVTKASFLPADPEQEPLISKMNNKVTVFPTLSSIAEKKPEEAKEILAVLESIYDGEYRRSTAKGTRGLTVDTVIIGSLTPEVFEHELLPKMISYGSRFLIHRYDISQELALEIGYLLGDPVGTLIVNHLTSIISSLFTYAIDSINFDKLMNVVMTPTQESELDVLADLMSRLRIVFHRRVDWIEETDESTGRVRYKRVEMLEPSQFDAPIRARMQLLNFVRANASIRSVPRVVGLPQVDDHSMKLACKLAISSSYRYFHQIIVYLLRYHDVANVSTTDIGEALGLSRMTVYRYLEALHVAGVITDTVTPRLEEKYYKVLAKYLIEKREEKGGRNA
jgi:biotin operon repressor